MVEDAKAGEKAPAERDRERSREGMIFRSGRILRSAGKDG